MLAGNDRREPFGRWGIGAPVRWEMLPSGGAVAAMDREVVANALAWSAKGGAAEFIESAAVHGMSAPPAGSVRCLWCRGLGVDSTLGTACVVTVPLPPLGLRLVQPIPTG